MQVTECTKTLNEVLPLSDAVITGVPTPNYKLDVSLLKEGVVAVNFSSFPNIDKEEVLKKASLFVPSVCGSRGVYFCYGIDHHHCCGRRCSIGRQSDGGHARAEFVPTL